MDGRDIFSKPIHVKRSSKKGDEYYETALHAVWQEKYSDALDLFEEAASCYRADGSVYALAKLRVNELIARYLSQSSETERKRTEKELLDKADRVRLIESLEPPFAPIPVEEALKKVGLKMLKAVR